MPRRRMPPRLYLHPTRKIWIIRDGQKVVSTGCAEGDIQGASKWLQDYIGQAHKPQADGSPLIADVLLLYHNEHLIHVRSKRSHLNLFKHCAEWWGDKCVTEITPEACRSFITSKGTSVQSARGSLETLRAALNYWHKSQYGPLERVPTVLMPPKAQPRERWLTDEEFNKLLGAADGGPDHLKRFLLLGWHTGTRPGAILSLEWSWLDLRAGVMRRRSPQEAEDARKRTPPVRLGETILAHLRAWYEEDGPARRYVVHLDGHKLVSNRHAWDAAVKAAGLTGQVTPHVLRHSCATRLMQKGFPPAIIAGFLGMTVETLMRVYGHHSPDYQKDVSDA